MAEDCCDAPERGESKRRLLCPECGRPGLRVTAEPVRFLVVDPSVVTESVYFLCESKDCETVYFDAHGGRILRSALWVRVGAKETQAPHLVCYCFGHTEEAIEAELRVHGKTTIPERIRAEIAAGTCECEFRNPAGRCCLGNVAQAIKRLTGAPQGGRNA